MLLSTKHLSGFKIDASDGDIGDVHSFLIDDQSWVVRYIVVETGSWFHGRKVLVVPSAAGNPDGAKKRLPIHLTRDQIENSPEIDTDMPVSRRQEIKLHRYYQWQPYWVGGVPSVTPVYAPGAFNSDADRYKSIEAEENEDADPHLQEHS